MACCQRLMNGRAALESAVQRCALAGTGPIHPPAPPVQQRPLLVMNDCIFTLSTCLQTRSIMRQLSSGDLYLFRVLPPDRRCYRLFLIAQPSVPTGPSSSSGVAPWKKHAEADAICINFQMEGVKACSATAPVCLKSAKAL